MAPVVSAALGALGPLLTKLADLLAGKYGRLKGVRRREIRAIGSELTSMHGALSQYTKMEDPNDQVKAWISLVRELAYDTEDFFDNFILQLGNRGFRAFFPKIAQRQMSLGSRRTLADQIHKLKNRIKEVKELKNSYKLDDALCNTTTNVAVDSLRHSAFVAESHLVGVDGPRDDLAKWMIEGGSNKDTNPHRMVLSIVGFGGLGKTTLANEVFHKIQGHFQCCAFVSVSQKPDLKKIIKNVISQVSLQNKFIEDYDIWDEQKAIMKLRELLKDKRYLVIIDDIWSTQAWNAIMCAFPENKCSSRIIATTRIVDVARSCCPSEHDRVFPLKFLSSLHSRRLFFERIFGSDVRCPDMLEEVSSEILKICGGLPLAIISISSLLVNIPVVKELWDKVRKSIGYALGENQSLAGVNVDLSHVRSLTVGSSVCIKQLPSLDKFEALHVLNFECCQDAEEYIMNSMDKLLHLKYLSLRGTNISELPPWISMLLYLETLDLRDTHIQELPARIVQFARLKHLLISSEN